MATIEYSQQIRKYGVMTQPSIQSLFSGGAGKSAKFEKIGDKIVGKIIAVHEPEESKTPKGEVKRDKNGRALMMIRIELQTEERNPEIEFDDGVRTLYVRSFMLDAVGAALHKVGAQVPEVGGVLEVIFTEEETNPGLNPSKKFEAVYVKPSSEATQQLFNTSPPEAAANPLPAKPVAFSDAAWAGMDDDTKRKVAASMASVSDGPPF